MNYSNTATRLSAARKHSNREQDDRHRKERPVVRKRNQGHDREQKRDHNED